MKYLLLLGTLAIITTTSCKKLRTGEEPTPQSNDTSKYDVRFAIKVQHVITSVADNKLTMIYNENVSLLLPANGYTLSWAVHLTEDFSQSALKDFDYTTTDQSGDVTFDWVDDNLNNVQTKTIKDTVVNKVKMNMITVTRPFTFSKTYTDNQSAVNAQSAIMANKNDQINFSSYVYFGKDYPTSTQSAMIDYINDGQVAN